MVNLEEDAPNKASSKRELRSLQEIIAMEELKKRHFNYKKCLRYFRDRRWKRKQVLSN